MFYTSGIQCLLIFVTKQLAASAPKRKIIFKSEEPPEAIIAKCLSIQPLKLTECAKILYEFAATVIDPKVVEEFTKNMSRHTADLVLVEAFLANIGVTSSASSS